MSRKMKFKRILLCALMILIPLLSINNKNINSINMDNNNDDIEEVCYNNNPIIDSTIYKQFLKDSIMNLLVDEANTYIKRISPKAHDDIPRYIVQAGLDNYIDIMFMMAQTQIETNYGTLGAGRPSSRRSIFGVSIKRYDSYEKAINDYVYILKKNYLRKGRTEHHLMTNYTTVSGTRYAENRKYEIELKKTYNYINKNTRIRELQEKYRLV
jgi:flagellum-specific peptidoglycan hydrolase FlgJ